MTNKVKTLLLAIVVLAGCRNANNKSIVESTKDSQITAAPINCTIDPNNIEVKAMENFKGGEGTLMMKMFQDGENRIMFCTMPAGSSVGYHTHDSSFEVVLVEKGTATILFDSIEYTYSEGQAHYCPKGHSHSITNATDSDLVLYNVVGGQ